MDALSLVGVALRASLLFALALVVALSFPRSAAALRRWVLLLGVVGALVLPLLTWAVAGRRVVEVEAPPVVARVVAEALSAPGQALVMAPVKQGTPQAAASSVSWRELVIGLWLAGAILLLARASVGVLRAGSLARRARPAEKGIFLSDEGTGPVVVGLLSPRIVLPESALESWVVRVDAEIGAARLAARLRAGRPPIIARVHDGGVLLDVRTLLDGDEEALVRGLLEALR